MKTLKTKLHHYSFESADSPGFLEMVKKIEADGFGARGHQMHSFLNSKSASDLYEKQINGVVEDVEIDTQFLFDNQWNETAASGNRRLFDWFDEAFPNTGFKKKRGHWIEITQEMANARKECFKCGYCGEHYGPLHTPLPEHGFCLACIGGPYLKEEDLRMLRIEPIIKSRKDRQELSEEEKRLLVPLYVTRQTTAKSEMEKLQLERERQKTLKEFETGVANAVAKRDGMLHLIDRDFSIENVIYYSHTCEFGFGWRTPVSGAVLERLLEILKDFPAKYHINTASGKKIESGSLQRQES